MTVFSRKVRNLFLILLVAFPAVSSAEPFGFTFISRLMFVSDLAPLLFGFDGRAGQTLTGSAQFRVTGPDQSGLTNAGVYPTAGTIRLPFTQVPVSFLQVIDNEPFGDFVGVVGRDNRELTGSFRGLFTVLGFQHAAGELISSDAVPDPSVFEQAPGGPFQSLLVSTFVGDERIDVVIGTMTATTAAPIPEPSTLLLFGTAATGLAAKAWKRRRRTPAAPVR
jgi:hypothetical protein